jgi:hypothetical protein
MRLSSPERRQLAALAAELARDNPRLARALVGHHVLPPARRRMLDLVSIVLLGTAVPVLVLGVLFDLPMLIGLGGTAAVNAPFVFAYGRLLPY